MINNCEECTYGRYCRKQYDDEERRECTNFKQMTPKQIKQRILRFDEWQKKNE